MSGCETTLCTLVQRELYYVFKFVTVMPGHQPSVVPPPQDAALIPVTPPTRDTVIRWALRASQLNDRGHAVTRLSTEITELIVGMTHRQEHRDCIASVFADTNALPKCQACGSVSKFSRFVIFPPLVRRSFFSFFSFSTNITCATLGTCGSDTD